MKKNLLYLKIGEAKKYIYIVRNASTRSFNIQSKKIQINREVVQKKLNFNLLRLTMLNKNLYLYPHMHKYTHAHTHRHYPMEKNWNTNQSQYCHLFSIQNLNQSDIHTQITHILVPWIKIRIQIKVSISTSFRYRI